MRLGRALIGMVAGALVLAAAPLDPVKSLAGRYSAHFQNGNVDGDRYWSDDVVEIVPVDAYHAYFRVSLHFFNGHSCGLYGIAQARGATLDYRAPPGRSESRCHMTLSHKGDWLNLDDHAGTCQAMCGARGGFAAEGLPWKSKRPILYLARVKGSDEYRSALAAWRKEGMQ